MTDKSFESPKTVNPFGNPAAVGLGAFGLTTLMLQFHNLGWVGLAPVIWLGFFFGGAVQMIAGYQEQKMGNNFGYAAFTSYGAFWISLAAYLLGSTSGNKMLALTENDLGWLLFGWTLFTVGLWFASLYVSKVMFLTFTTLLIGFVSLVLVNWGHPGLKSFAAWDLIVCALLAWYMMSHIILRGLSGRDILPVGKPLA
ncbi:acetate uptake transporter [uncultured Rhodoblastus sp.]|uniref:acetate uptake transporter n=1 Tax=uncultured Rhodoblastus sp. TaxID=543037 RepID=UPI0025D9FD71|nr:acetate uptake transporter [uncultured Rhodoblastus sp.]